MIEKTMPATKYRYEDLVHGLVGLFNLILSRHEAGIAILLGILPPPSSLDIYDMKFRAPADLGVRIDGGDNTPLAESIIMATAREHAIIREVGGWSRIHKAVRYYRSAYPEGWQQLEEYALFIRPGGMVHDGKGGMMSILQDKYDGVCSRTLRRRKSNIVRTVVRVILSWLPEDDFYLKS